MRRAFFLAFAVGAVSTAIGDDGYLTLSGSPKLMTGHPSISMEFEHVVIHIRGYAARYECRFRFKNDGPATTVRMGFPDWSYGSFEDSDEERILAAKSEGRTPKPVGWLLRFRSWVDGRPVATKLEASDRGGRNYRTKLVRFAAGQTRSVVDRFVTKAGVQVIGEYSLDDVGTLEEFGYVMETGASWKGPIGHAIVDVSIDDPGWNHPRFLPKAAFAESGFYRSETWRNLSHRTYAYQGFGQPTVNGRRIRFEKRNWKPTKDDDIFLATLRRKRP